MSNTTMLFLLLLTPLAFSLLTFACRLLGNAARACVTLLHFVGIMLLLAVSLWVVMQVYQQGDILAAGRWLHLDSLSALFLAILGIIGCLTGL